MLGFPTPYPQELLYSTVARAGIHDGETSPKQLLDRVFGDRKIIATFDLPSHVQNIANQYPESLGQTAISLINAHTLWPLYAPFLPDKRRKNIEHWMISESHGAAHLASGIAASRIKLNQTLQVCPACMEEHKAKHGEAYWNRCWQSPLVKSCLFHGPLHPTNVLVNDEHRHAFVGIEEANIYDEFNTSLMDKRFISLISILLDNDPPNSPTYWQWTQFYRRLAKVFGFTKGARIDHSRIMDQYIEIWTTPWLKQTYLMPSSKDTSWLKSIFRKHRKSFSFAEHVTVIDAISGGKESIQSAFDKALRLTAKEPVRNPVHPLQEAPLTEDQLVWLSLVREHGPKPARKQNPALYARLYRAHYAWLMKTNAEHPSAPNQVNTRVDWNNRDRQTAKIIVEIIDGLEADLYSPRMSRTYLLHQLSNSATIEKNLDKLPRTRTLLAYYTETIPEYQVRRLTLAITRHKKIGRPLKRWSLLREAGLSDLRISKSADAFLKGILRNEGRLPL